jgi:hypothetical protein
VDRGSGEDRTERLARTLAETSDEDAQAFDDLDEARRGAATRLEDSDERVADPAVSDPHDQGVIRRTSDEAASDPDVDALE